MSNPKGQTKGPVFRFRGAVNEAAMNALTDETFATGQIVILTFGNLTGETFTLFGTTVTEGVDFDAVTSNDVTAANLATALDLISGVTVTSSTNEVDIVNDVVGIVGNLTDLATDADPADATISGAFLTGGQDDAQDSDYVSRTDIPGETADIAATGQIVIVDYTLLTGKTFTLKGTVVTEGAEFSAVTSNDVTATNLAAALDAIAGVTVTSSTNEVDIVNDTAGVVGNETDLSTNAAIGEATVSAATLLGGKASLNIVWIFFNAVWSSSTKGLVDNFEKSVIFIQDAEVNFLISSDVSKKWTAKTNIELVLDDNVKRYSSYITAVPVNPLDVDKSIRIVAI